MYRLLSRLWRREVDAELLSNLQQPPLAEAYTSVGGVLPNDQMGDIPLANSGHRNSQILENLALDFCQLFLGPSGHLPPYQSVWAEGQFEAGAAASMQQYIEIAGYQRPADTPSDALLMYDHLSIQLDVMGHLGEAIFQLDETSSCQPALIDIRRSFFHDHLCWPQPLLVMASRQAQTEFYRAMIAVTAEFLHQEKVGL